MRDLSKFKKDYAVFLPAISGFYAEVLGRAKNVEGYLDPDRVPKGFENGIEGLNFLDDELGYFYYDMGLYSAGHAYLDLEKSHKLEWMIQDRDRDKITMLGDSGGYQIGKGVINFDWEHFYEKPGDMNYKGKADKTRGDILNWLEHTADWSLTLDVPTWAYLEPTARERTGLRSFDECLNATLHNLDYFVEHRQGKTKYLNILQGTTWEDTQKWYDAVKDYPFEGWAMGGNNIRDIEIALRRLIVMRDEGKLEGENWVHFLGTSKLEWSVLLTGIRRALRKHVNPNLTVSFDAASPFIGAANGRTYTTSRLTSSSLSYVMELTFDDRLKRIKGTDLPFPFEGTEIGERLLISDIMPMGPGDLNKQGNLAKSSWDALSYVLIGAHNCNMHIRCVQRLQALNDFEKIRFAPDWRTWAKSKRKTKSAEFSRWIPRDLLYWNTFIEELFTSSNPMSMIDDARPLLQAFNNLRYEDSQTAIFSQLFDDEADEVEMYDREDDVLDALELQIRSQDKV